MLKLNKIYNLDCLKGLKKIENKSIDLIITSPPFNLGNTHHTGFKKHKSYDDKIPEKDYQLWQLKVLNECFRVLKDNGSMMYQHKNRISKGIQISPYEWIFKSDFIIKQEIVWINRSQNFDKIRFYPFTERVYWLAKNTKTKLINTINKQDVFDWKDWKPVGTKGKHTRAFPEKLVEDFLKVFPKARVVLDPFMGSGTVGIVCKRMKRNFIGFETIKEFVEYSKKRLS